MTTPEQLAKLTNDAKLAYFNDGTIGISHEPIEAYVSGYLRRCQETEQAIKDARKQALEDAIAILDDNKTNSNGAKMTMDSLNELLK